MLDNVYVQDKDPFINQHSCVWGQTQAGKTYWVKKNLERSEYPAFFFNPQYEDTALVKVDKSYSIDDLINAMKQGEKLDYHPSTVEKFAQAELDYIISAFFRKQPFSKEHPFDFAIDECHIYAEQGARAKHVRRIATGGFKFGFRGIFISQSPSSVDKLLLKQSSRHIFFYLDEAYEGEYMRNKGYDFASISKMVGEKESHKGVLVDFNKIKGLVKV